MAISLPENHPKRRKIAVAVIVTGSHAVFEVSKRFITIAGQYSIVNIYESRGSAEEVSRISYEDSQTPRVSGKRVGSSMNIYSNDG